MSSSVPRTGGNINRVRQIARRGTGNPKQLGKNGTVELRGAAALGFKKRGAKRIESTKESKATMKQKRKRAYESSASDDDSSNLLDRRFDAAKRNHSAGVRKQRVKFSESSLKSKICADRPLLKISAEHYKNGSTTVLDGAHVEEKDDGDAGGSGIEVNAKELPKTSCMDKRNSC